MGDRRHRKRQEVHALDTRCGVFLQREKHGFNEAVLYRLTYRVRLEEDAFALRLDFGGSDEGDTGGVSGFGRDVFLRPLLEDFGVPAKDGVVIDLARRGDLLLEIGVLLHRVAD